MARRTLPPLAALRGFDAAARHLSFTGAAAELGLTQGAVSRQVKALEEDLGQPLFRRLTRRIVLTPEGTAFHRTVEEALALLAEGAGRLRGGPPRRLTLSALPTIASAWLMPRLDGFARRHPGLEVRLLSSIEPVSLAGGEADLAIRVGRLPGQPQHRLAPRIELEMVRDWRGLEAMPFLPDVLVPVCRAEWLPNGPLEPAALAALPLIHVSTRRHAWPDWLRAQGVRLAPQRVQGGLSFSHFFMALEAARKGQGVALVPDILLPGNLPQEGLAVAGTARIASAGSYVLLRQDSRKGEGPLDALHGWLLAEAWRSLMDTHPGGGLGPPPGDIPGREGSEAQGNYAANGGAGRNFR
ncbi:LysR substrate-binding domain-containing protein [Teichococcus aestuarii]|nr:LysR substrate-binding domain-containing protein [Pseudoroseomonas aestuarii]